MVNLPLRGNFRLLLTRAFDLQSASDGQDAGSMTEKFTQRIPASQFPQSTNPSRLSEPTSNSRTPIKNELRGKSCF